MSASVRATGFEPICIEIANGLPTVHVDCESSDLGGVFEALKEVIKEHDSCISLDFANICNLHCSALEGLTDFANTVRENNHMVHLSESGQNISRVLDRLLLKDAFCMCDIPCGMQHESTCDQKFAKCKMDYFTLTPELFNGRIARKRVDKLAEQMGYSTELRGDIQVAVGEAFANAVLYGSNSSECRINVSCLATPHKLCITVTDSGSGFEPENVQECTIEQFCEHGRGIQCIEAFMDEVSFEFDLGTTIRMTKHINN